MAALQDLGTVVSGSLQLQQAVRQLTEIAVTDPLTGLYNRKGFELLFDRHSDSALGLLALDLDNLKMLNDRYGHAAGDAALVALGRALRAAVRASDVVARLGGDEFVVLVKDAGGLDACEGMADRIRWHLARLLSTDERFALVGVSIGTHFEQKGAKSLVAMMLAADKVLYERKANARRSVGRAHGALRTR
jgi:diguanylate cyclase (GGDEF)-like protein